MPRDNLPAHEHVYSALQERVLYGEWHPGMTVTLQGVADLLAVSLTPVREAVRRLIAQGALEFHGNRRISVPKVHISRLSEIYSVRKMLEPELAEKAALHIADHEIDAMEKVDFDMDAAIGFGDIGGYLRANHTFHFALYRASQSHVILPIVESLWLQFGPSLRVACGRFGTSKLVDQHKLIIRGLRERAPDAIRAALLEDIGQGFAFVRDEQIAEENTI